MQDRRGPGRRYRSTHPWIRFPPDLRAASPGLWSLLGQVATQFRWIERAALPPAAIRKMKRLYLVKGARATTAIEGNTLTEAEVGDRVDGRRRLPPTQRYLGTEVDNVLSLFNEIASGVESGESMPLTPDWIREVNRRVLAGLDAHLYEEVEPGAIRKHSVVVGRYRGAPAEDCAFLLERLCAWVEEQTDRGLRLFEDERQDRLATATLTAILAHLYVAWIHPFGDGNGRTARMVEFMLLARSGAPLPSAQLPSNHFNKTRDAYYFHLDGASRGNGGGGDPIPYVLYALRGFAEELDGQREWITGTQMRIAWRDFVQAVFRDEPSSPALDRRREIALTAVRPIRRADIRFHSTPMLARLYATRTEKTVTRDLNWLLARDLIVRTPAGYRSRIERMRGFLPPVAEDEAAAYGSGEGIDLPGVPLARTG